MEQLLQHESHSATTIDRECRFISMNSPQVNNLAATGLSATQSNGNQAAHDQTMSIDTLAHRFVNNVKVSDPLSFFLRLRAWRIVTFDSRATIDTVQARFGEQSGESMVIYGTLGDFNRGEVSKRDTISIISGTLAGHIDLKYDLLDILQHQDARWAPGDFDLPQLSHLQLAPLYLEPIHQPQMRLPSMSTAWDFDKQTLRSFDPVAMSSFDRRESYGETEQQEPSLAVHTDRDTWRVSDPAMLSSPVHAKPSTFLPVLPVQLSALSSGHRSAPSYADLEHEAKPASSGSAAQVTRGTDSCDKLDYENAWSGDRLGIPLPRNRIVSQMEPCQTICAQDSRLDCHSESVTALSLRQKPVAPGSSPSRGASVLGNPFSMPIGQPAVDTPPLPRRRNRKPPATLQKNVKTKFSDNSQKIKDLYNEPLTGDQPKLHDAKVADSKIPETSRRFVHSVCGKSFATRAKVKKHHWGHKTGDLETTTGCWAKNKKPNLEWNDHPSCKETVPSSNKGRFGSSSTSKLAKPRPAPLELRASLAPTMLASRRQDQFDIRPIHSLPCAAPVAQNSQNTSASYPWAFSEYQAPSRDELPTYRTHSVPPRSPFEDLLTAVNVAAKIDAPVPQGRTDSAVNHLDAQVLAAERDEQSTPAWALHPRHRDTGHGQHYLRAPTGNDTGHYSACSSLPMPKSAIYASRTSGNGSSPSTMSYPARSPVFRDPFAPTEFMEEEAKDQDYYLYPPHRKEWLGSTTSPGPYKV
jgi:hypothetical protein